ncbi:MAG: pantetheine-phosphate adenylyltransferase [Firmicutes bacterium]|uniref:Phosphopantetheine adenylyltransferase n=1 Tax=Candidatus Gallilactobacillus intestinavium TaxID=2840838 RepID=A0A9D9H9K5_9LACO|nr:pantetheine-phosphate adenylyltransferase [Candidatus Gallilactobacillus intestinavium]
MDKIAVFPGSFDPLTNGHLDIIKRAIDIFDKLIVTVAINTNKNALFSLEERVQIIQDVINYEKLSNVQVMSTDQLTVDFMKTHHANYIVRGIRNENDYLYERDIANINSALADNKIESVFLLAKSQNEKLSSSMLKEIIRFKGDISQFVPKVVLDRIDNK